MRFSTIAGMDTNTPTELVTGSDSPDVSTSQGGEPPENIDKLRESLNKANKEAAERRVQLKALQADFDALKQEQATAGEQALAEQGKFKELYEAQQKRAEAEAARAAELEGQIKAQELAMLRQRVATEKGLPVALAARLQGDTADEIAADADALLKALPLPAAASLDGGARGAGKGLSPQDAKAVASRFNIDPRYLES